MFISQHPGFSPRRRGLGVPSGERNMGAPPAMRSWMMLFAAFALCVLPFSSATCPTFAAWLGEDKVLGPVAPLAAFPLCFKCGQSRGMLRYLKLTLSPTHDIVCPCSVGDEPWSGRWLRGDHGRTGCEVGHGQLAGQPRAALVREQDAGGAKPRCPSLFLI